MNRIERERVGKLPEAIGKRRPKVKVGQKWGFTWIEVPIYEIVAIYPNGDPTAADSYFHNLPIAKMKAIHSRSGYPIGYTAYMYLSANGYPEDNVWTFYE